MHSGRHEPASRASAGAVAGPSPEVSALLDFAAGLIRLGRFTAAADAYRQALAQVPDDVAILGQLAALLEKLNDLPAAAEVVQRGLGLRQDAPALLKTQAALLRRQGQPGQAMACLERLLPDLTGAERADILFELGRCHDLLGETAPAYRYFCEGNQLRSQLAPDIDRAGLIREYIDPQLAWLPRLADAAAAGQSDAPEGPVFVAGFPRSGTTLIDQILDSHPRLYTLEERECMPRMHAAVAARPGGFPEAISHLTSQDKADLRAAYQACVHGHLRLPADGILVDKLPLHILRLPLLQAVFPGAKLVLVLRHPCDTCLSCFMNDFRPNLAMANFFTLEDTVRLYVRTMDLWLRTRPLLRLPVHVIRYEDLLADFSGEVGRLLRFIGVDWDDRVRDFDRHALGRRGINTPSYHQVCRPIHREAEGRWRRYAEPLAAHLPALRPFIAAFGYPE